MMTRYAAFLRGINLGKRRIKMDRLARLFEELEFANIATFIASGNVIFDAEADEKDLAAAIESHLLQRLGYEVDTFIRSMEELQGIARGHVFEDVDGSGWSLYVIFLKDSAGADVTDVIRNLQTEEDLFEVRGREIYWLRNGRMSDSPISTSDFARALGGSSSTMRTMNTVVRILDKYGEDGGRSGRRRPDDGQTA